MLKLSVVIPARNEEGSIRQTLASVIAVLERAGIPYEILVVDDGCTDKTDLEVQYFSSQNSSVKLLHNLGRNGFGMAVRTGLDQFSGAAVAIVMADGSDDP